jgi:drug/metabolite transporter (DMT)-like permease
MVIGAGILAFGSWYVLAERSPLSLMVVSLALQPPVAALLGYFFLREALTVQTAVGTLFVLVALGLAASEPKDELAPAR